MAARRELPLENVSPGESFRVFPVNPDVDRNVDPERHRMLHAQDAVRASRVRLRWSRHALAGSREEQRATSQNENNNTRIQFFISPEPPVLISPIPGGQQN